MVRRQIPCYEFSHRTLCLYVAQDYFAIIFGTHMRALTARASFCIFLHNAKNGHRGRQYIIRTGYTKRQSMCRTVRAIRLNLRVTPFYLRAILIVMPQYPRAKTTSPNLRVAPFYLRAILIIIHQYTRLKTISPNLRVALFYLRVHFKAYVLLGSVVPPELSTTSFCIRILRRFTTV